MTVDPAGLPGSHAILIGVSTYQDRHLPDIPAAANSLRQLEAVLTDPRLCGWPADQVTVLADPSDSRAVAVRIRRLAQDTTGVLLLYYVGHGAITPGGELCLTVADTDAEAPDLTGVEYARVRAAFHDSPAQVKAAILDCCYSGRAIETLAGEADVVADHTDIRGVYTLTASDLAAHVPPPGEQSHACTSFTGELVDLIRTGIPGQGDPLTLGGLYLDLRRRLRARELPAPNQRGTDTAHGFAFTRNAASGRTGPPSAHGRLPLPPRRSVPPVVEYHQRAPDNAAAAGKYESWIGAGLVTGGLGAAFGVFESVQFWRSIVPGSPESENTLATAIWTFASVIMIGCGAAMLAYGAAWRPAAPAGFRPAYRSRLAGGAAALAGGALIAVIIAGALIVGLQTGGLDQYSFHFTHLLVPMWLIGMSANGWNGLAEYVRGLPRLIVDAKGVTAVTIRSGWITIPWSGVRDVDLSLVGSSLSLVVRLSGGPPSPESREAQLWNADLQALVLNGFDPLRGRHDRILTAFRHHMP
ncbi:caspase family protein [Acrocarpospora phusangensis]|nr:caspase family protein [Acrocarpospora phusangensis]